MKSVLARFESRHEDDRHILAGGILANAAADLEPVEAGHDDVEQDEIDA